VQQLTDMNLSMMHCPSPQDEGQNELTPPRYHFFLGAGVRERMKEPES
jgi:hypothetical protein